MAKQRGLSSNQEQDTSRLIRDVRPLGTKIADFYKEPDKVGLLIIGSLIIALIAAPLSHIIFIFAVVSFIVAMSHNSTLPFRIPMRSKVIDHADPTPTGATRLARGIYHFGNEKATGQELWFANDDMRTHALIFGSTGAGKTETLLSIAYNALVQASGFIYVDGKGDNSLFAKVFSMMKYMGREDDLLLINFMTGARDIIGAQEKKQSNTMNPFSSGSSGMLSNLVASMMDSGGGGGDGDMWKGRAIAFVEALFKILVYQRDAGNLLLDADSIRNYFSLERLEAMVADKVFIRDGQFDISLEDVPEVIMAPITNYLLSLPGYVMERKGKQVSQVFEQHGYITMQLTRTFSTFADSYGHIMRVKLAEVDLKDVVLNRRVLVTLLPALEKSPDELANLGKIVIASMRTMMATGLGDSVEGTYQDVILTKPTNATTPFLCVLDEYGYYAVKGFAVVPAQARSLGFSCIFAGQDLPAFQKASKEEAASIGANTNVKICMKLEDPTDTWEFFMKGAGESYVTAVESFSAQSEGIMGNYSDTKGARAEKRARIDLLDLKEQVEGEAHIFFKSKIIRARMFYAGPPETKGMRLNVCLKVDFPPDEALYNLVKSIEDFEDIAGEGSIPILDVEKDEELDKVIELVNAQKPLLAAVDQGLNTIFDFSVWQDSKDEVLEADNEQEAGQLTSSRKIELEEGILEPSESSQLINIFNYGYIDQAGRAILSTEECNTYASPLVRKVAVERQIAYILKTMGRTADSSKESSDCIERIEAVTAYNSTMLEPELSKDEMLGNIKGLIQFLQSLKEGADDEKG